MNIIDKKVVSFLAEHHLFTLATSRDNLPYTSNEFYAFDAELKKLYIKTFSFAIFMDLDLWMVEMDSYKFTDNTLGFGKKLHWTR